MAEEPEQILVKPHTSAILRDEERRFECEITQRHDLGVLIHREPHQTHNGRCQNADHENRYPVPGHAPRAHCHDRGDQVHPGDAGRECEGDDADLIPDHAHRGLGAKWLISRPAITNTTQQQIARQWRHRREKQPEAQGVEPRECHIAGPDHQRHDEVTQWPGGDNDHGDDHHNPVGADNRVVKIRVEYFGPSGAQLGSNQHGQEATQTK